jgi:hypothetical protein
MRLMRRTGVTTGLALLAATAALVSACGPGSAPTASASASPGARPTTSPTTASPAVARPTPPGPDQPWGGLVWLDPVSADVPWGHLPKSLIPWQGQFVALDRAGDDGSGEMVLAASRDLIEWTVLARDTAAPFRGAGPGVLLAGPAGLVALGPGDLSSPPCPPYGSACEAGWEVWTSADGSHWKAAAAPPFALDDVIDATASEAGLLVLANLGWQKPAMWYSADGSSWRGVDLSRASFSEAQVTGVHAVPGGFVATGGVGGRLPAGIGDPGGTPGGWWSADGLTWTKAQVAPFENGMYLDEVYAAAHGLLATGFRVGAWSSSDGHSWAALSPGPLTEGPASFVSDGSHCVAFTTAQEVVDPAVGASVELMGSVDGRTWRRLRQSGYDTSSTIQVATDSLAVVTPDGLTILVSGQEEPGVAVLRGLATP